MIDILLEYDVFIIEGFLTTVYMTLIGIAGGTVLGILTALGDVYGNRITRAVITGYVEFFRGSPLMIQLFLFAFAVPEVLNVRIDAYTAGIITLMLNSGAYQKGYFKGAIESVFKDQLFAAKSLGLTFGQTVRLIVLPQALRIAIAPWTNEYVSLGLSTSALTVIGIRELTTYARAISAQTFRPFEVYLVVGLIYFAWIYASTRILYYIYERLKVPGLELKV